MWGTSLIRTLTILLLMVTVPSAEAGKQKRKKGKEAAKPTYDNALFEGMEYRLVGPFRGGRSAAVAGIPGQPTTFYFGATGGGVWKTTDGGSNWRNITDGFFGGSIGAVTVSEWDPNVIYVGGGEKTVRGNVSHGYGMWKSTDAGRTWQQIGLEDSRHIARIRVHPRNPDVVYVAAMGHLSGPNDERGIYRTVDGGKTWEQILFVNNEVGAVDLVMDPTNPRIMFASFWRVKRTPYSLESGGEGSGLYKSTDGGDTWEDISRNEGLPKGTLGIIGVSVSKSNPDRIYTIIEAEKGGVYRSEDGGKKWRRVNEERSLRQRAWYYTRIYADPVDEDTVYVLNVGFWKSKDGGKSFSRIGTPHGDHHDLWIAPEDPKRMVIADDGGGQVTFDGGKSWSTYYNQPTAQFYRVATDSHFPYRIYGGQQDNSTVRLPHRTNGSSISESDWEPSAGGESGYLAPHPTDPDIVYGGSYGGLLHRMNHRTKESRLVDIWPDNPMGHGAADLKYRFQWNFPIFFSPHDPNTLYAAANVLFKTTDEGETWEAISGDLTRDDKSKQGPSGGPITKDNTSVEYYCTIFAAAESHHEAGTIWTGSDDGLIHVTRDGGKNWANVTPKGLPEWTQINNIEIHPTEKGGLYVAGTRYKLDDFQPYLYRTLDYGKSWTKITAGIDPLHFTRAIRADPDRKGLLYAGTESGMYVSFNDGELWQPFQLNLPVVPITDLAVKEKDLVVATQGRSFWVFDDLTPLHQLSDEIAKSKLHLYAPRDSWRMGGRAREGSLTQGTNLPGGVLLHIYLAEELKTEGDDKSEPIVLTIMDAEGKEIRSFSTAAKKDRKHGEPEELKLEKGVNRFVWNMRYLGARDFQGMIVWSGNMAGPRALPGQYQAKLKQGNWEQTVAFELKQDPRSSSSLEDLQAQFDFLIEVRDLLDRTHEAIGHVRAMNKQVDALLKPLKDDEQYKDLVETGDALKEKAKAAMEALYQTKNRSRQDPLNFPIRLNDKLAGLNRKAGAGDFRPTAQALEVKAMLSAEMEAQLKVLDEVFETDLKAFNEQVKAKEIPAIRLD